MVIYNGQKENKYNKKQIYLKNKIYLIGNIIKDKKTN